MRSKIAPKLKFNNLDATGTRIVKRGSIVEFEGGFTAKVSRVRLGYFATTTTRHESYTRCNQVKVIG